MEPRFRRTSSRRCCRRRCRAWASRAAWGRATTWKRARVRAHGEGCCCHLGLRAPRWAPHRRLPTGRTSHTNLEARRHRRPRRRPRRRRSHLRRHQRRLQQTCARRGSRCSSTASACPRGTATRGGTQQPQSLTGRPTSAWRCGAGGRLAARPWRRRRRSCPRCSGQTRSSTHTCARRCGVWEHVWNVGEVHLPVHAGVGCGSMGAHAMGRERLALVDAAGKAGGWKWERGRMGMGTAGG
eukprot:353389-Chlamydomonas_euryale.AAC.2